MRPARRNLILGALLLAALLPRLYHVRSPFMSFADHNTANFTIFARNYLDHGWLATRLGQARDVGPADAAKVNIFAHHPPTIALLTSLSFALLGVSEWVARTLPLLLSAATAPVIFLLVRGRLGALSAALAAFLFALSPGAVYYGQMLDHESFVVFLGLMCLVAWHRHAISGENRWRIVCLTLLAAASLTDWPGAYLAPAIALGSWLRPAGHRDRRSMAMAAFSAAGAALALVMGHILFLKGSFADLLDSLSFRILSSPELSFTWMDYLHRIQLNLEYALTPPIFWLSMAGGALLLMEGLLARAIGEPAPDGGGVVAAVVVFGVAHHLVFRNACHFNEHLIYYLLPSTVLLAAAAPVVVLRFLRRAQLPEKVARAGVAVLVAVPLTFFALQESAQIRSYFNDASVPGWALAGQALHEIIPEDGVLLATGDLANPQFLAYLRRNVYNQIGLADLTGGGTSGAFLLHDLNAPLPEGMRSFLAAFPAADVLNHSLHDLTPGSLPPEIPALTPAPSEWALTDIHFGDALRLSMARHGPSFLRLEPREFLSSFLGVPWTPARAAGRIVHASFVWERLDGKARTLNPEYSLVLRVPEVRVRGGDVVWRAPFMWPLPGAASDLASLLPGDTARQEIDWFLAEWLPDGDYEVRVAVLDDGRALRAGDAEITPAVDSIALGSVGVRTAPAR